MTPGHIRRDCPLPVAAANPGAQQPAAYQPPPLPEEEDTGAGTAANRTTTGHPQSSTSKLQLGQQQSTINIVGQRQTYQPQMVHALQQHHPAHPPR